MSHQQKMLQIGRRNAHKKLIQVRQRKQTFTFRNIALQCQKYEKNKKKDLNIFQI